MPKMTLHIGASISGLQSALGKAKNMITGWAGAMGGALSAAGLVMFAKKAIDAADAIYTGSRKLEISTEAYQKLSYAAEDTGASMENVHTAFKKMSSTISDAMSGNKTAIDSLAKLGVSIDDLKGKSPDEQFSILADALNQVTDATDKAAFAQDIFGKSGTELIGFISKYKELGDEIEKAGGIMEDSAITAAKEFKNAIDRLGLSIQASLVNSGLMEWLKGISEGLEGVVTNAKKMESIGIKNNGPKDGGFLGWRHAVEGAKNTFGIGGEGKQFDANVTAAEKAKLEANKKKFEETGKTTAERKSEKQQNAERIKHQAEALKQAEAEAKEFEKRQNLENKQSQSVKDSISELQKKIDIQKLINAGKEKEAAIQEAINEAESKAGRALTDSEKAAISAGAGEVFDLSKKADKMPEMKSPEITDAVKRIGGSIGASTNLNYSREQLTVQKQIADKLQTVLDNMGNPGNSANSWS